MRRKDELIKLRDDITIALQNAINHTDIFERVVEKEKQIEEEGDKTGDFIIYHEILKFLKRKGKDGIFPNQ
ncbi:MAG: hypothetical protein IPH96_17930 [Saprospiraceae bacterium]|nr:hypothetical protein [Saprospiraceae bacterium]